MAAIIKAVHLESKTTLGRAGFSVEFGPGLNLLRADNSSGKSTCLQAIIYGLGLEGMISARRSIPLPHSMTDEVELGEVTAAVLSSKVTVVLENQAGEVLTVQRVVKDPYVSPDLIRTWNHDGPMPERTRDFFVRLPGAAQRDDGFHKFLPEFFRWTLPRVAKTDGGEVPLYLETLFPYFYVEQKHGWTSVQARLPTYLGIREVGKRAAEFILALDVYDLLLRRQRLTSAASELERDWRRLSEDVRTTAARFGLAATGFPERIPRELAPDGLRLLANVSGEWIPLARRLAGIESGMGVLRQRVRTAVDVGPNIPEVEAQLVSVQESLRETTSAIALVANIIEEVEGQIRGTDERLESLREDRQRHRDSALLARMGSIAADSEGFTVCPTCTQELTDGHDIALDSLTVMDNISLIEEQITAFEGMRGDAIRRRDASRARLTSLQEESRELRRVIRGLKRTLEGAPTDVAVAASAELAVLEDAVERYRAAEQATSVLRQRAEELTNSYAENRRLFSGTSTSLSDRDKQKLGRVSALVREQLVRYHFSSIRPQEIEVSTDTYRPTHDGFDLGSDLSASDMIRLIWAYLIAMLIEGSRSGHHLGILILDEPRQQDTARQSYAALLQEAAATCRTHRVQIICATSEESASLRSMLQATNARIVDLPTGSKLVQLVPEVAEGPMR